MARKFPFTMWTYNDVSEFTPDEVDVWADCGMTDPMGPATSINKAEALIPFLNRAQARGIKLIGLFWGVCYKDYQSLGAEEYEKRVKSILDVIGNHPALRGLCVGDEPLTPADMEATKECIAVQKRLAPHLTPFINYRGGTVYFSSEQLGGRDLGGWMKYVADETGSREFCFDIYSQAINEGGGTTGFYECVSKMVDAAKYAGCEAWACLLSSAHHVYHKQTEVDILWQISASAAMGIRGIQWFRFYDRLFANECCDSPVDEFGNKTELYYGMMRAQLRFNAHYGELFMRLNHKKTYALKSDRGIFPEWTPAEHDLIKSISPNDETIVSFFEDVDGTEYLCLFHTVRRYYGVVDIDFDASKCSILHVRDNGKDAGVGEEDTTGHIEKVILPASLALFKIERK